MGSALSVMLADTALTVVLAGTILSVILNRLRLVRQPCKCNVGVALRY